MAIRDVSVLGQTGWGWVGGPKLLDLLEPRSWTDSRWADNSELP